MEEIGTYTTPDVHASSPSSRFDKLTRPMAITKVLQSGIDVVNVLRVYLLSSTFKGQDVPSQTSSTNRLPLIFDLAESSIMQDATI